MAAVALRVLTIALLMAGGGAGAHVPGVPAAASSGASSGAAAVVPSADASAWVLHWSFEPWVVACLLASAALYAVGLLRLWRRAGPGRGVSNRHAAAFAGGWVALVVALLSPVDPLGTRLFSAHMLQHELLMVVAAPLMVVGKPLAVWVWALPPAWRRGIGAFFHHPAWRVPWLQLSSPLGAWLVHALALWLWHVPALFDAALANEALHTLQHFSFLFTALLFWWSALGQAERIGQGTAMIYLFTTMIHSSALGALLTLSPIVWYPTYLRTAPALGIPALEDQQLGGLVMWIPAGIAYFVAGLLLAMRWIGLNRGGAAIAGMPSGAPHSASHSPRP
jgi:putative membrane protein